MERNRCRAQKCKSTNPMKVPMNELHNYITIIDTQVIPTYKCNLIPYKNFQSYTSDYLRKKRKPSPHNKFQRMIKNFQDSVKGQFTFDAPT